MDEIKEQIKAKMAGAQTPSEYFKVIDEFGLELMDNGTLDSDELHWEVGRELWADKGEDFEAQVYKEFEKAY